MIIGKLSTTCSPKSRLRPPIPPISFLLVSTKWFFFFFSLFLKSSLINGHFILQGKLHKIITQNIDSLHFTSGVPLEKIIEIHGHCRSLICSNNCSSPLNPIPFKEGGCDYILNWEEARLFLKQLIIFSFIFKSHSFSTTQRS